MTALVRRRGQAVTVGAARAALRQAGRLSSILPLAAMLFGLLVPRAAEILFAELAVVSAVTVFCGLMAMEAGGGVAADWRVALRLLPLVSLLAAVPAWALGMLLGAGAETAAWMALVASAPVSALAVANTAALGLPARAVVPFVMRRLRGHPAAVSPRFAGPRSGRRGPPAWTGSPKPLLRSTCRGLPASPSQ